jgi:pimeloyl-ACP methyl ester carboxylesterase
MMRQLIRAAIFLCFVTVAPAALQAASSPTRTINVDGSEVRYRLEGTGGPLVVLEAGFGGKLDLWDKIFGELARSGRVFAYSRPGAETGGATPADADGIRTSEEAARTLRRALDGLHLRPPYILVGASLGGLYVQKFAQLYPARTAGIVLVDNRPPPFLNACRAARIKTCTDVGTAPNADWSPYLKATFIGIEPSEALAPTPEQLGAIPVTMITGTATEMKGADDFLQMLIHAQTEYAHRLTNGRQVLAQGATHESLVGADGNVVVREVEDMRSRVRRQ